MQTRPALEPMTLPQHRIAAIAQQVIGVLLIGLLGVGITEFLLRFFPEPQTGFIPLLMVLFASEAIYTHTKAGPMEGTEKAIFRFSEIVSLLVLTRIALFVRYDLGLIPYLRQGSLNDALAVIVDSRFLIAALVGLTAWAISTYQSSLYVQIRDRAEDVEWEDLGKIHNSLKHIRTRLIGVSAAMLIVLVAVAALVHAPISIPNLYSTGPGERSAAWLIMVFSILMLAQLALSQLIVLRTRWYIDKAHVTPSVTRLWFFYALGFFILVGVIAALMPTQYSIGFFDLLLWLVHLIYVVVSFLLYLISLPIILLTSLFSSNAAPPPSAPALPSIESLPPSSSPAAPIPFWETFKTILLWGSLILVILFALYQFLGANRSAFTRLRSTAFFGWFGKFFAWVGSLFRSAQRLIREQIAIIQEKNRQNRAKITQKSRFMRQNMDSRERIIYIYQEFLDFAAGRGYQRRNSQTPLQYHQYLSSRLPEVDEQVADITRLFSEARYSAHPIDQGEIERFTAETEQVKQSFPDENEPPAA